VCFVNGKKLLLPTYKDRGCVNVLPGQGYSRVQGPVEVNVGSGGTLNSKENPKIVSKKPHFIYNESHVKITRMESETL
jgi:hypothetical protein